MSDTLQPLASRNSNGPNLSFYSYASSCFSQFLNTFPQTDVDVIYGRTPIKKAIRKNKTIGKQGLKFACCKSCWTSLGQKIDWEFVKTCGLRLIIFHKLFNQSQQALFTYFLFLKVAIMISLTNLQSQWILIFYFFFFVFNKNYDAYLCYKIREKITLRCKAM